MGNSNQNSIFSNTKSSQQGPFNSNGPYDCQLISSSNTKKASRKMFLSFDSNLSASVAYKAAIACLILLAIALALFCPGLQKLKQYEKLNIVSNSMLLLQTGFGEGSNPPVFITSQDDVPRWVSYDSEKSDLTLNLPSSRPAETILSREQSSNLENSIIFDNDQSLNFQIVAGITGQKLKLAEKLLNLNLDKGEHSRLIFDFERRYYQQHYEIGKYEELPMCIIVPTYNNSPNQRFRLNLQSIIQQQYQNYKVVIIDDFSQDSTAGDIENLIAEHGLSPLKYILVRNNVQMRAMYNIRSAAIADCQPEDVMIIVDGDDQLVGRQVFKLFNAVFQKEKVWFVYSNFIDSVTKNVGYSRPFPDNTVLTNTYRHDLFYPSHLRSFYTSLFLNIKESDLRNSAGEYFQAANDVAICLPILQMSHLKVKYLPEITYGYNSNTGSNNHILRLPEQKENDIAIRKRQAYKPLEKLW